MNPAALQPLKRNSLTDDVVAQLRAAIVSGRFPPAAPLTEPLLAEQFGVSRAPIREALISLEREGLVEFDRRGRTRVCQLSNDDFDEICSLRAVLEGFAARLAVPVWTAADSAALERNIEQQSRARTLGELAQLDADFHEYVVRAAGHERLLSAWLVLRPQMETWLGHTFASQERLQREPRDVTVAAHRMLLEALVSGQPDHAVEMVARHAESWRRWHAALAGNEPPEDRAADPAGPGAKLSPLATHQESY